MARPRNNELFARVTNAAFRQFHQNGYVKTTYASIAREAGCGPTTVQDYYPKKELMAQAFFSQLIEVIREESRKRDEERSGVSSFGAQSFAERFRDGTLYYSYLQERCRQYLVETTSDVAISNSVLIEMARWAYTDAGRADVMEDPTSIERIVKSLGGFHALLNYQLMHDMSFDVQRQFTWLAYEWLDILGYTREETLALVEPGYLSPAESAEITLRVSKHFA